MRKRICPVCGKEDECLWENLCEDCFRSAHPLIEKENEIENILCECGSIFLMGKWRRGSTKHPEEELISESIKNSLKKAYKFNYPVKIRDIVHKPIVSDSGALEGYNCQISLEAMPNPTLPPIVEKLDIQVGVKWWRCDQCQKILTQQYSAILQIRLPKYDENILEELLDEVEGYCRQRFDQGDSEAYISSIKSVKKGIDLYLGSQKVTNALAKLLEARGAKTTKSFEAYGFDRMKAKWKQRMTIAAIFPPFSKGTIISYSSSNEAQPKLYFQLLDFIKNTVRAWNFSTNSEEFITDIWSNKWNKVAEIADFTQFQIVSIEDDGETTLLMQLNEPWGYFYSKHPKLIGKSSGEAVRGIVVEEERLLLDTLTDTETDLLHGN
ncbi:MAG: NMD3-related protein [Candidatus Hodarchaeota archaeon]